LIQKAISWLFYESDETPHMKKGSYIESKSRMQRLRSVKYVVDELCGDDAEQHRKGKGGFAVWMGVTYYNIELLKISSISS